MEDSIFTKIIKGEIPCHKIHEDAYSLAFLDINPIQPGMVLVVSKQQVDHIWDLPADAYDSLMQTVYKVANQLRKTFPNKKRVAVIVEGFEVAHAHVKLFPVDNEQQVRALPARKEPDHVLLAAMADKLRF